MRVADGVIMVVVFVGIGGSVSSSSSSSRSLSEALLCEDEGVIYHGNSNDDSNDSKKIKSTNASS